MAGKDPRQRLLEAAIDHIATRGVTDLSLRELAAAIGTSHRMLIHHFGNREGLWVEVIRAVEAAPARRAGGASCPTRRASVGDAMRQWWRHISDPSLWPNERLFFELYGQALQGRPGTTELLDGIVDAWLEPARDGFVAFGVAREEALAQARLGHRGQPRAAARPAGDRRPRRRRRGDGGLHRARRGASGRIARA